MRCGVEVEFDIEKIVDTISKVSIRNEEAEIEERLRKRIEKYRVLICGTVGTGKTSTLASLMGGIVPTMRMSSNVFKPFDLFAGTGGFNRTFPSMEYEWRRNLSTTNILDSVISDSWTDLFDGCPTHALAHNVVHEMYHYCQRATVFDILYQDVAFEIEQLEKRREELRKLRKLKTERVSAMIRAAWLNRNTAVGRSSTSAVTDLMLLSIPTPPTFKAANRSLEVGGAVVAF